ncbi:uncharacterized protein LOC113870141 [Abrus precatorius]|uniref:Uncharacterized protein LOC113870141 n=1 Tax=Abrus precatorius TaxID=3816 RepID=A0A8B8M496_ABRPR|nr:uncharacterized protein LOC113870141 [Abrus precatorius]
MPLPNTPTRGQRAKESPENDAPIETSAGKNVAMTEKTSILPPVSPFSTGEGLPYAPEGWPNPDDVWTWKVGRRTTKSGHFHDRYLYLPKSLLTPARKAACFQSKLEVMRYLESNFPNMELEAFFALFSWQIPSTELSPTKAVPPSSITRPVKSLETREDTKEEIGTQRKLKRKAQYCIQPTRKSFRLGNVCPRLPHVVQDAIEIIDLCYLDEESEIESAEDLKNNSDSELYQTSHNSNGQPENSFVAVCNVGDSKEGSGMQTASEKHPNVTSLENFDDYLDTLEDLLVVPPTETSQSDPVIHATTLDNEMMECCKEKLSSFLAMDFPSLASCNNVVEVATLASQIRKDPSLSVDQLAKLKLVEQIPLVSEAFLEAKGNIEEADKFFADLEAKTLEVPILKNKYNDLKDQVAHTEAEIDKISIAIQEIDDQISQLHSKRNEISSAFETKQKRKAELTSRQTMVASSIPTIVHEIQLGLSEKSKWELKKANSAQRVAEIHEKFITLRDTTF